MVQTETQDATPSQESASEPVPREPGQQPLPQQQPRQQQPRQQQPRQQHQRQQRPPRQQQGQQPQQQNQQPQRQSDGGAQNQQRWPDLSIVIPLYNEEESLRELHQQLKTAIGRMNWRYELVFVDDGSTDKSFQVLRDLKRTDRHIKIVRFRRNYGKSAALAVGFEKATGNVVVTMDADLQDDPAEIPALKRKLDDGFDLVSGWKKSRKDPLSKTIPSRLFNFVVRAMTGIRIHDFNCGLKAYRRDVIKSVNVYGELHRYIPVLAHWEGFKVGELPVRHRPRRFGKTKFGFGRFWKGFLDLLTVIFTTRYFRKPLHLFGLWGLATLLAGMGISIWLVVDWFQGRPLSNRPLFLAGIFLVIVGIQFISIGLLGEMITKSQRGPEEYAIREYLR